jgi:hypothetical protein
VWDGSDPIDRLYGLFDTGDLPFIDIDVFVDRFGGQERAASAGALGEPFKTFLDIGIDADGERCGRHGWLSL